MVQSLGVPITDVGKWAGICTGMFSICQAMTATLWGAFSDRYGRKITILLGLLSTMITSLMWGCSTSLPVAILARGLSGAGNGNVGIIRTMVAELVPHKELQPRAFIIMPTVWNLGATFGPMLGGLLANPYNVAPDEHITRPSFFQRFPYALPNVVSAGFFAASIVIGLLYLEETLETLRGHEDYGLRLGRNVTKAIRSSLEWATDVLLCRRQQRPANDTNERDPLLKQVEDVEDGSSGAAVPVSEPRATTFREVLNRQSILNLVVYTFLAMHTMGYDQLLPVSMAYPSMWSNHPDTTQPSTDNPLKFAGGYGLDHFRIGLFLTCYGICGMSIQLFVFPPVARRFGVLNCLKWCSVVYPLGYLCMPFTTLFKTQREQVVAGFAVMILKAFCAIFAFPCSTIMMTNAAPSLRVLGTLNGISTSTAAIGRAAGPALGGAMFTLGVKRGYGIASWWSLALVSICAAIPVFWLEEGDGFGGDDQGDDEDGDGEALEDEQGTASRSKSGSTPVAAEAAYGGLGGLLSRTTTASSAAVTVSDENTSRRDSSTTMRERHESRNTMRRVSISLGLDEQRVAR